MSSNPEAKANRKFRSATSGLWYENPQAAGSIDAVGMYGEKLFREQDEESMPWIRRVATWAEGLHKRHAVAQFGGVPYKAEEVLKISEEARAPLVRMLDAAAMETTRLLRHIDRLEQLVKGVHYIDGVHLEPIDGREWFAVAEEVLKGKR